MAWTAWPTPVRVGVRYCGGAAFDERPYRHPLNDALASPSERLEGVYAPHQHTLADHLSDDVDRPWRYRALTVQSGLAQIRSAQGAA
jgi:hypothetical protein